MEMTQKQIEIEAQNYLNSLDLPGNADKQLIVDNFKNGIAWALLMFNEEKQQLIDKACDVLTKEFSDYFNRGTISGCENLHTFKKAMEEL